MSKPKLKVIEKHGKRLVTTECRRGDALYPNARFNNVQNAALCGVLDKGETIEDFAMKYVARSR